MFSVQFLITKKWRGPFYHGSDFNVYSGPQQRKLISCTCAQSSTVSGSYVFCFRILVPGQTLQKRLQDYHQNPVYKKLDSGNGDGTSMGSDATSTHAKTLQLHDATKI